jgi:hypothetical protein
MAKTNTQSFAARVKSDTLTNAAIRHMMAIRAENIAHPEVKRVFNAIPAAYKREQQWDDNLCKYVGPNQKIYVDASQHSSIVSIYITIYDLDDLKTDKRLSRLLATYLTPEWEAMPTTDNAGSERYRGRTYTFNKTAPIHTKESHPSVKWLRKADKTWDLDDHMKKPLTIRVCVSGYVKEANTTCRIEVVEVREEVIKTEVKRLVCA